MKIKKGLRSASSTLVALMKKHAPTLLIIKAISWGLMLGTGAFLTWLWIPLTAKEIAQITVISLVVSHIPFLSWVTFQIWKHFKHRQKE